MNRAILSKPGNLSLYQDYRAMTDPRFNREYLERRNRNDVRLLRVGFFALVFAAILFWAWMLT